MRSEHAESIRRAYPRVLGKVAAATRSLPDAEDALHDAIACALDAWPRDGAPDSAEAWLIAVALNRHRDRARRSAVAARHEDALEALAAMSPWARIALGELRFAQGWKDELLGVLFACCHPCLDPGEGAALALATVIGLSNGEVSRAFMVAPRSMEQRLLRARQRLREHGDSDGRPAAPSSERVDAVLRALHLLFNEGYWSTSDEAPVRADLCRLAIGLARSLAEVCVDDPEARGLLALILLHDARRPARLDACGAPVPLPEQDRSRWDHAAIASAAAMLEDALREGAIGPFQIEAAISAVHCRARSAAETDWCEIAALYALLEAHRPSPVVRAQRAFAVARAQGPRAGIALLEADDIRADSPLVYGALLAEVGRIDEARAALSKAAASARNRHERAQIEARIAQLSPGEGR